MEEARLYWEALVESCRRSHGEDDKVTLKAKQFLAVNLAETGARTPARELFRDVYGRGLRARGSLDESTVFAKQWLDSLEQTDSGQDW